jgi:excinuclease UvrABC helicase subunit UvrB
MQREVYQWLETFRSGTTIIVNEDRSGRPTTSRTADNVERVNTLVQEDRRITVTDIANKLDIRYGSTYFTIRSKIYYVDADLQTLKRSRCSAYVATVHLFMCTVCTTK